MIIRSSQSCDSLITEGLRVQQGHEAITYINVGHAMEDISAKQNHTVFARRGCGKTLLLHDSAKAVLKETVPEVG